MIAKRIASIYTLNKSKRILRQTYLRYQKQEKKLSGAVKEELQASLLHLQTAIMQKEAPLASKIAKQLSEKGQRLMPKTFLESVKDSLGALLFALAIAIIVRTMWFELYTIPSGSMRPTLKEGDFLVVSKTDYGINVPLSPNHFYFDPALVKRGGVFVFTGKNMDIPDADTIYFYLFPGKKLFVKRLIGKPGDTIYFYGGQLYGIDAQGRELIEFREDPWFKKLEHLPFIRFDGKVEASSTEGKSPIASSLFYQMNEPVAKLSVTSYGTIVGEMLTKNGISQYSDLWGFKHFAMARLLTAEQIETLHPGQLKHLSNTPLYLELTHHPSLKEAPLIRDEFNRIRPDLHTSVSLLPLNQQQIITLSNHMLTCRFVVENGFAHRYGSSPKQTSYLPSLPDVPDGTYEIEEGKAYKIGIGGIATELEPNHPLYRKDPATIQLLYNLGIEFITYYNPSKNSHLYPSRYAYFRNQDLYLLGVPVVKKEEPELTLFLQREYQRQSSSLSGTAYLPFDDAGPPLLQDGSLDVSFIRKYGIRVPDKMYLALGDNHAMSADSRQFGFVPEDNIRGGASFLFWPPGPRWGQPFQPTFPHLTFPNLLVWGIALSVGGIYFFYTRKKRNQNIQF